MSGSESTHSNADLARQRVNSIDKLRIAASKLAAMERYLKKIHPENMNGQDWHEMRRLFLSHIASWQTTSLAMADILEQLGSDHERSHPRRDYQAEARATEI